MPESSLLLFLRQLRDSKRMTPRSVSPAHASVARMHCGLQSAAGRPSLRTCSILQHLASSNDTTAGVCAELSAAMLIREARNDLLAKQFDRLQRLFRRKITQSGITEKIAGSG
jgi:hypothetical protein